ncbi:MAG: SDR family oxidoreductase [Steroidobacteraceae bacterium]|jgi:NAD(P)-dependent dehydrogenase (short-subunit alcohol dehydrogenase family)|nr:SDR family oxidoreductase [Steroidobacteraceae bacterium]
MDDFADRRVLVTGGDGGVGAEVGAQFAARGAHVILAGIRPRQGAAVAARIGAAAEYVALDVADESQWVRVVADVLARHGRLDVVVNNAGYLRPGLSIEDTTLEEWRRHFAVNADGAFLGCKHGILAMKGRGSGAIVNVSSAVAVRLHPQAPAYGVSKASILATTRVAAQHCGQRRYGIRVNCVLPGPIDTEMMRSNVPGEAEFARLSQALVEKYGMPRIGVPADVANLVTFLASDAAAYVTGAAFTVDGGQSA